METDTGEIVTFFMETTAEPLDLEHHVAGTAPFGPLTAVRTGRWGGERLDG